MFWSELNSQINTINIQLFMVGIHCEICVSQWLPLPYTIQHFNSTYCFSLKNTTICFTLQHWLYCPVAAVATASFWILCRYEHPCPLLPSGPDVRLITSKGRLRTIGYVGSTVGRLSPRLAQIPVPVVSLLVGFAARPNPSPPNTRRFLPSTRYANNGNTPSPFLHGRQTILSFKSTSEPRHRRPSWQRHPVTANTHFDARD